MLHVLTSRHVDGGGLAVSERMNCWPKLLFHLAVLYLPKSPAWPETSPGVGQAVGWRDLCSSPTLLGGDHPPQALCPPVAARNPVPNKTSPCPPASQHVPVPFQSQSTSSSPSPTLPTGPMHDRGIGKCCAHSNNTELAE